MASSVQGMDANVQIREGKRLSLQVVWCHGTQKRDVQFHLPPGTQDERAPG